jgi:hypothetical protein
MKTAKLFLLSAEDDALFTAGKVMRCVTCGKRLEISFQKNVLFIE